MRRRKWKGPNNPTIQARQIWRAVYGEPWPKGWKVKWVGFMRGAYGLCKPGSREILLSYADAKRWGRVIDTLLHEFIHVRHPKLRHGKEFDRLIRWSRARLIGEQANVSGTTTINEERNPDPTPAPTAIRHGTPEVNLQPVHRESEAQGPGLSA